MSLTKSLHILVTGANGQLGMECRFLSDIHHQHHYYFEDRNTLPIGDKDAVESFFRKNKIDVCINAAAYTAVDLAETEKDEAYKINAEAVGNLASICDSHGAQLIHISTDYVFDGKNQEGYVESDTTDPINIYGLSKCKGEELAIQNNKNAIIIRTSWVFSSFGKNFVKTMMRLMSEKESINVVCDQTGRPTFARDLASAIFAIIENGNVAPGIYHYANQGVTTWFDFANAIKEICGYTCQVNPIPSSSYPVPAKRPSYSILQTEKISKIQGVEIPFWKDSLEICINLLRKP
jgi:dTDP-4-dehydrorhamnose reductase